MAVDWNAPGWSLSAELFFYVLFPFVITAVSTWSKPRLITSMLIVNFAGLITPLAYNAGYVSFRMWQGWLTYNPLIWLPAFLTGILLERSGLRVGKLAGCAAAFGLLLALTLCPVPDQELLSHGALFLLFAVLISSLATWTTFLGAPSIVLLGNASYALYILHMPLWNATVGTYTYLATGALTPHASGIAVLIIYILFSIAVSIACYRWFERPARQWLKRQLDRREARVSNPARVAVFRST